MSVTPATAGQTITAAMLAAITPTWSTWTPTWSTTTGSNVPSLGNASVACEYCQAGDLIVCSFDLQFGSTTNFGGGTTADNWTFSLPVSANNSSGDTLGFMSMRQSDSATLIGRVQYHGSDTIRLSIDSGRVDATAVTNVGLVDLLSPWTWTSGNTLHGNFQYRAA